MNIKVGDAIAYKDSQTALLYGIGMVKSVTDDEYTILWARRGLKKYRRSVLDQRLTDVFQKDRKRDDLPQEKRLQLSGKMALSFNENYDRAKVGLLCAALSNSGGRVAKRVADGLAGSPVSKKPTAGGPTREVLRQLAELCGTQKSGDVSEAARQISQELFFGYVIQGSDFERH